MNPTVSQSMDSKLSSLLDSLLSPHGFESHPFLLKWYNSQVTSPFRFDALDPDTLAFVVVSIPNMFEDAFLPFISGESACASEGRDPIDACIKNKFQEVIAAARTAFKDDQIPLTAVEALHDFEMTPGTRRPKVLVQTAAHVAGAAYYYQQSDVEDETWKPEKKMFGVCLHPRFGGWFAIRGVLIFHGITCPDLPRKSPPDVLPTDQQRIEVLERFNGDWKDGTYRDVIPVEAKYSEEQKLYFATPPGERQEVIKQLLEKCSVKCV